MRGLAQGLGVRSGARAALVGPTSAEARTDLEKVGAAVEVFEAPAALAKEVGTFDWVVVDRRALGGPGAAMAAVASLVPRLFSGGSLVVLEPKRGALLVDLSPDPFPVDLAKLTGLEDRTPEKLTGKGAQVLGRPSLPDAERRRLAKLFRLEGATRVGVFGWPLTALPTIQRVARGAEIFDAETPGRGPLDVAIFFAQRWADRDSKMLERRLGHGGTLVFAWERRDMKPATVVQCLAPFGFAPRGKPAPLSLMNDGWLVQVFEPTGAPKKKAATKKTSPTEKKAPTKAAAPKPPAMPPPPAPSDDPLGKKLQALLKPASVVAKTSALRGAGPTSVLGPVTWAPAGAPWPEERGRPLEHRLGVRVDELPSVPDAFAGLAWVSVFQGPSGPVVHTHATLDGLEKQVAPGARAGSARAVRWAGAHDCPDDLTAASKLRGKPSLADLEATREDEALDHHAGLKLGGWPTAIQGPMPEKGFALQLDGYGDEGLFYIYRKGKRWTFEAASY